MDDNISQNTITITSKHITFSQLNVIIFKTLNVAHRRKGRLVDSESG
jgi:hypothetical protein